MTKPMSETVKLAAELISLESVTPEDAGCQPLMQEWLTRSGFEHETMVFAVSYTHLTLPTIYSV